MPYGTSKRVWRPFEYEYTAGRVYIDADAGVSSAGTSGHGVAWSPDGQFVAFGSNATPFINVYRVLNGVIVEKMASPASLPGGFVRGVAWSPSGAYIAVAENNSPYVDVWAWSTAGFGAKVSNPASLPGSVRNAVAWHPSETYLLVGGDTSPFVDVYAWSAGFGARAANPGTLPAGNVHSAAWSSTGGDIFLGCDATPFIQAWPFTTVWGTIYAAATAAAGSLYNVSITADDRIVIVSGQTTPFIQYYRFLTATGWQAGPTAPGTTPAGALAQTAHDKVLDVVANVNNGGSVLLQSITHDTAALTTSAGNTVATGTASVAGPNFSSASLALSPDRKNVAILTSRRPYLRIYSWLADQ